jgi:hypothetical protein
VIPEQPSAVLFRWTARGVDWVFVPALFRRLARAIGGKR